MEIMYRINYIFLSFCVFYLINFNASSNDNLFPIKKKGQYGYINPKGEIQIKPKYKLVSLFTKGFAVVRIEANKWQVIDCNGNILIECSHWLPPIVGDAVIGVNSLSESFLYKPLTKEKIVVPQGILILRYSDELFLIKLGKREGYLDLNGKYFCDPVYENCNIFNEGLGCVKINGTYQVINKNKKIVFESTHSIGSFSCGLATIADGIDKWGYINRKGMITIPTNFHYCELFYNDLAVVQNSTSGYAVIDKEGTILVPFDADFKWIGLFNKTLAPACKMINNSERYGYINKNGEFVITPKYARAYAFYDGYALVEDEGNGIYGYIDEGGKYMWKGEYEDRFFNLKNDENDCFLINPAFEY